MKPVTAEAQDNPTASGVVGANGETTAPVEVYWRPGCPYCTVTMRALHQLGAPVRTHNIWEDTSARAFVRRHNRGNETVPTVVIAGEVFTNPHPARLQELVRGAYPALAVN